MTADNDSSVKLEAAPGEQTRFRVSDSLTVVALNGKVHLEHCVLSGNEYFSSDMLLGWNTASALGAALTQAATIAAEYVPAVAS